MHRLDMVVFGAWLASSGCGLISSDIASFDLRLPEKQLTVDTEQWGLSEESALPAVDCSGNPGVCPAGIAQLCAGEGICSSTCVSNTCRVQVLVNLWHAFDLATERPEVQQIDGQPLVDVNISRVTYEISDNSLSVASPELGVYVAPEGVTSPRDPQAMLLGTIATVAAGTSVTDTELEITASGKEALAGYMQNYSTPFHLILASEVVLSAGDPVPTGLMVATIKAEATAGL